MNYIIKLSLRNVGRNRRRSALAILSVLLSITAIVVLQGMISGVMQSLVKNYTKNETGHIRITTKAFDERSRFSPVTENLPVPDTIINKIKSDSRIASSLVLTTERITFGVLLNNGNKNKTAIALAGDPDTEKKLLMLQNSIISGRYLAFPHEMIMGEKLAADLGFTLNDTVKVMTSGSDYALHLKKFVITGLFRTGLLTLDQGMFQISTNDARKLLNISNGTQQIIIMLNSYEKADQIGATINEVLDDSTIIVKPWTKIGDYYGMMKMAFRSYNIIFGIIALLGAFIIGNIMMMVILERRKETGILKSMGITNKEILLLFITEGTLLGFAGSMAGAITGTVINCILHFTGVDFSSMTSSFGFPIDNIIHFSVSLPGVLSSILLGTILSALIAYFPSRKAARATAIELIKSV